MARFAALVAAGNTMHGELHVFIYYWFVKLALWMSIRCLDGYHCGKGMIFALNFSCHSLTLIVTAANFRYSKSKKGQKAPCSSISKTAIIHRREEEAYQWKRGRRCCMQSNEAANEPFQIFDLCSGYAMPRLVLMPPCFTTGSLQRWRPEDPHTTIYTLQRWSQTTSQCKPHDPHRCK